MSDTETEASPKQIARSPGVALALTLFAPLLVLAGERMDLPGVDPAGFRPPPGMQGPRVSSQLALGVMPFISAALVVELAALVVPSWQPLRHGGPEGRRKLSRAAAVLGVIFSVFQGFGMTRLLGSIADAGDVTEIVAIASLSGGAALLALLADLVTARGLASGYAVLLVAGQLISFPRSLIAYPLFAQSLTPVKVLALIAASAAAFAVTWYALEKTHRDPPLPVEGAATYREPATPPSHPAIALPMPASGIGPIAVGASIIALARTLGPWSSRFALDVLDTLNGETSTLISAALMVPLAAILAWIFNDPSRVGAVLARARKEASPEDLAGEARARLPRAIATALVFLLALRLIEVAARTATSFTLPVTQLALAAALALDLRAEWRARRAIPDLVPVWPEHRPYAVAAAREALAAAGIAVHARGERLHALLQFFGPYAPIDLMVREKDAKRAAKILERVLVAKANDAIVKPTKTAPVAIGSRVLGALALLAAALVAVAFASRPAPRVPLVPTATLEFVAIDDDRDLITPEIAEKLRAAPIAGLSIQSENAPIGPGKSRVVQFARISRGERESLDRARERLVAWLATIEKPAGYRAGVGALFEADDEKDTFEQTGWRTYLLRDPPVLTAADVADAVVIPTGGDDPRDQGWGVRLQLTPAGAKRFEDHTGANIKRRFAILVDGLVLSAPVIVARIPGGVATITMGVGSSEKQLADAQRLVHGLMGR